MTKCYCCNKELGSCWAYRVDTKKGLIHVDICFECNDILYKDFGAYQRQWWKDHKYKAVGTVGKIPMDTEEK